MTKRASITFVPSAAPISEPVTKFGGQPVWLVKHEWPTSRATGRPMAFICQIALTPKLFEGVDTGMAYVFMTPDGDNDTADGTWDPDGGENAVVIQTGTGRSPVGPTAPGPSLYAIQPQPGQRQALRTPVEFGVSLTLSEDPAWVSEDEQSKWDDATGERYALALAGNKLGGTPNFIQGAQLPIEGDWHLLLQLDATKVPFHINFGDAGTGYAFMDAAGRSGKFLWQCY